MELTAILKKGEKQFVALCPELDVVSQGYTIEEAIKNLKGNYSGIGIRAS